MLQKNSIKTLTRFLNLIKRKKTKQKIKKKCAKSNLVNNKDFTFCKDQNTKEFAAKRSFDSKLIDLKELNHDTVEMKPNNQDQIKDLKKRKVVIVTVSELYKLSNICTTQYEKLTKTQKKRMKVQNGPENLATDLYLDEGEDDLSPMSSLEDD